MSDKVGEQALYISVTAKKIVVNLPTGEVYQWHCLEVPEITQIRSSAWGEDAVIVEAAVERIGEQS